MLTPIHELLDLKNGDKSDQYPCSFIVILTMARADLLHIVLKMGWSMENKFLQLPSEIGYH